MEKVCSFCGIEQSRTDHLFVGSNVAICEVCVQSCKEPLDAPYLEAIDADRMAEIIAARMNWGPVNCGCAVRARFHCEYCGKNMLNSVDNYYSWEIDHIIPGRDDSLDNCALACRTCNHLKHHYVPVGVERTDLTADARRKIDERRRIKMAELQKLRGIIGLPALIDHMNNPKPLA